jgi:predicted HTH domain antitoxin
LEGLQGRGDGIFVAGSIASHFRKLIVTGNKWISFHKFVQFTYFNNKKVIYEFFVFLLKKRMNTQSITIDFPSDILLALNETEEELKERIKTSLAMRLYRLQKLTIGKAAQLSGLSRFEFETMLSENGIPISNLTISDVEGDMKKLK